MFLETSNSICVPFTVNDQSYFINFTVNDSERCTCLNFEIIKDLDIDKKSNFVASYAGFSLVLFLLDIFVSGKNIFHVDDAYKLIRLNFKTAIFKPSNKLSINKEIFSSFVQGDTLQFNIYKNTVIKAYLAIRLHSCQLESIAPKSFLQKLHLSRSLVFAVDYINQQLLNINFIN